MAKQTQYPAFPPVKETKMKWIIEGEVEQIGGKESDYGACSLCRNLCPKTSRNRFTNSARQPDRPPG
jgi:hypothetical protein